MGCCRLWPDRCESASDPGEDDAMDENNPKEPRLPTASVTREAGPLLAHSGRQPEPLACPLIDQSGHSGRLTIAPQAHSALPLKADIPSTPQARIVQ